MRTAADYYLVEEIYFALLMKEDTARLFDSRASPAGQWTSGKVDYGP
jgi:hypothetical protein